MMKSIGYSTVYRYTEVNESGFYHVLKFQIKAEILPFQKSIIVFVLLIIINHYTCNQVL